MSRATRQQRRDFNATGHMYTVKTGFKSIFHHQGLADMAQRAVNLVKPIIVEGLLLANLHVLRLLESNRELPKMDETFFNRCFPNNSTQRLTHNWLLHTSCTARICQLTTRNQNDQRSSKR